MPADPNDPKSQRLPAPAKADASIPARLRTDSEDLIRKISEQEEALAVLRATLEATTNGILVVDERGKVTGYNEPFIRLWRVPRPVIEPGDHEKLLDWVREQVKDPDGFMTRAREIYAASPPETSDVIELADGRVFERHSRRQVVGGRTLGRVWSFHDVTHPRTVEEELRHQREWFRVTLSSIGDAVITTDTDANVTFLNPIAEKMTGWKLEEAMGQPLRNVFRIVNEKTGEPTPNPVIRVLREGTIVGLANHTVLIARDGSRIAIEDSAAPIRDAAGQVSGAVMVFHDVTARRKAEERLRESEERLRATFSQAAVGIAMVGLDGKFAEINPRFCEILGYTETEILQLTVAEITHPDDLTSTNVRMRQLMSGEIPDYTFEKRYVRKDGSVVWSFTTVTMLRDAAGRPHHFIGIIEDITQRKEAEAKLQARERELSLIYHNVSDVIFYLGAEPGEKFRFLSVNQAFLAATGLPGDQVVGRFVSDVIPEPSLSLVLGRYTEAIRTKQTVRWEETTEYPSGKRVGAVSITPIFDAAGKCTNLIGTVHDVTERKLADDLRARLAAVVESSDDAIISKTLDGVITTWNKGAERIFGYTAEEAVGRSITLLIPPERHDEETMILGKLRRGERIDHYETIRVRKDGQLRNIALTSSPVRDAEGKIIGASKIAHDITHRKKIEEELHRSEERFRLLGEVVPQMIWTSDASGALDYYNDRWGAYIGRDAQASALTRRAAIHPEDRERAISLWERSVRSGEPFEIEYRLRRHDGVYRWFVARAVPLRDAHGKIVRWYGSATDIHQQKLDAEALREQHVVTEHLNEVSKALATELDVGKIVQTITDAGTRITRAQFGAFFYNVVDEKGGSYTLYTLSGVPRSAFEKFPMPRATQLFGPTFRGEGVIRLDDVREDPRFGQNAPHRGMPPGHLPVVSYLAVPVVSRSGTVLGGLFFGHSEPGVFKERDEKIIVGVAAQAAAAMDTAHLYQAEQQARATAEQANRAKDQFLAMLSHELRTPLTPVLAILSSLGEETSLPPALARDLEMMKRNVELEARLIDDLLDLTRVTRGKLELRPERVAVAKLIEDAIATCQPDLDAKRLKLVRAIAPEQEIFADGARVTQILWNLLKNSIKFTPEDGTITIRTRTERRPDGDRVVIEIQDTGIGIEPTQIEQVFEAFEQGNRQITRRYGGLGLGLAISRAIAEAHRGTITASSEGPDRGSTFTLTLPVKTPVETTPAPPPPPPSRLSSSAPPIAVPGRDTARHPLRILLVEDHVDTANIMIRMLRRSGYDVVHAPTIALGRELAEAEMHGTGIDLVISDLSLPDGSGLDLMRELSTKHGLRGIALSGFGMDSDRTQTAEAGFARHLTKPVNVALLRSTIVELVKGGTA